MLENIFSFSLNPLLLFFPGYAFLLFQEETSVQALIDACIEEDGKLYLCVSSPTIKDKPVSGDIQLNRNKVDLKLFFGTHKFWFS